MRLIRTGWKPVSGEEEQRQRERQTADRGLQTIDNLNEFLSNTTLTWPGTNDE